jgi:diadenosine tetraphosphate (Ap4A) HIT family hydrolase
MNQEVEKPCPFCVGEPVREGRLVQVFLDAYPVSPGHLLIVPKRHVSALWDLTDEEYDELFATARTEAGNAEGTIDGWNLGVNVGAAGGQTVWHVHLHLIPRRSGDTDDPRGGVRWVVPENAKYWT